jgi:putative tricarboxylic transport membrane protein
VTAILLSAMLIHGVRPGPQLIVDHPDVFWGLIASMYVGNVLLLLLNLPLVGVWVKLLSIPRPLLYAGILIFATLGAYGLRNSWFDLALLYGIGVIGFLMRRYDIPVAPVLVGMILGPLSEQQFRRALAISQGDLSIFVTQPISAVVLAITALVLIVPPIWRHVGRMRATAIGHPHHN